MRIFSILFCLFFASSAFGQTTSDFENFNFPIDSFLDGSDGSGGFQSGNIFLNNDFNQAGGYWSGWVVSSSTDVTTPGFMNQYSCIAGEGVNGSANYGLTYMFGAGKIELTGAATGGLVQGMYVNNNTYAYLSMLNGDAIAKKFGGISGDDPDFFLLTIQKYLNGALSTEKVEFYLADYRFADNSQDYIVNEWTYINLLSLGDADSLHLELSSSDNGGFGMNTPAYLCVDNLITLDGTLGVNENVSFETMSVFPNPALDQITIDYEGIEALDYQIYSELGQLVGQGTLNGSQTNVSIDTFAKGTYFLLVIEGEKVIRTRFMKG